MISSCKLLIVTLVLLLDVHLSIGQLMCGTRQCFLSTDRCCNDLNTGFRCYDPSLYTCAPNGAGQTVLCGKGSAACSNFCYDSSLYCCVNGGLIQKQFCTPTTTSSPPTSSPPTSSPPPVSTGGPLMCGTQQCFISTDKCCNDLNTGFRCYDPSRFTCAPNGAGQTVLCGINNAACGSVCYDPTLYCCQNGQLTQKQFCQPSSSGSVTTGGQPSSSASSTTGGQLMCEQACTGIFPISNRPGPCCNCCRSDQTCHEIAELVDCCDPGQAHCGCLSSRAFCSGQIFGSGQQVNPFGTCYDANYGTCCYDPNPNLWIVCPHGTTCCMSNSYFTCCAQDEVCTTTISSSYPICQKRVPSTTGGPLMCGSATCYVSGDRCCNDLSTGYRCYSPAQASCELNERGQTVLCPLGWKACGSVCYQPEGYCCRNGQITQLQFC